MVNDLPLGQNVNKAPRTLHALQFTEKHGEVCPANWNQGEEAMIPAAEGVGEYLSSHTDNQLISTLISQKEKGRRLSQHFSYRYQS